MNLETKTLTDLQLLFEFAPPEKLKASITQLLLQSLMAKQKNKQEVYESIYFLFDFLDKQEGRWKVEEV